MRENNRRTTLIVVLLVVAILLIDQVIKIEVKTNMRLHEVIDITGWFKINFIENNGMAYGMTFFNKLVLSLFRIVAISLIGYYLTKVIRKGARIGYIICLAMVFGCLLSVVTTTSFSVRCLILPMPVSVLVWQYCYCSIAGNFPL